MKQFVIPYIMLQNTQQAVAFYQEVFGGHVRYTMFGKDMPECPEKDLEKVMHLEYVLKDNLFYFADADIPNEGAIQLHLNYSPEDEKEMKESFKKMKQKGTVIQDLKEEFWGAVYGNIKDQFGITWQFHRRAK